MGPDETVTPIPEYFTAPGEDDDEFDLWRRTLEALSDYFGSDSNEYRLLTRGVVVHHGRMPGRLPRLLVELIERRVVRIVVATSTLTDGVNLPFETILVPSLARPTKAPARPSDTRMSGREFTNLVGRAGRPGATTEGQTLVLIPEFAQSYQRRGAMRDYTAVTNEFRDPTNAGPATVSPLARLLEIIRAHIGDEHLEAWLEQTAPLETDDTSDALDALDTLDSILLPALVDADGSDIEAALRAAWRATFAHAANQQTEALETMFRARGAALATRIYPTTEQQTSLYRTNLPPRDARDLRRVSEDLVAHLKSGTTYETLDTDARLDFLETAVAIVRTHRRFATPERAGRAKTAPTWSELLRWWLAPATSTLEPGMSKIGAWHKFIGDHFTYKFNWGLGAALSLATDDVADPTNIHTSERWRRSDMPWIALWMKELIEWGTLDPAVAFILARGLARTRPHAAELADEYRRSLAPGDDSLDIDILRAWAARHRPSRPTPARVRTISVDLTREFTAQQAQRTWRVFPITRRHDIDWTDAAGYVLARSDRPDNWRPGWSRTYDFDLTPTAATVTRRRYL